MSLHYRQPLQPWLVDNRMGRSLNNPHRATQHLEPDCGERRSRFQSAAATATKFPLSASPSSDRMSNGLRVWSIAGPSIVLMEYSP